MKILMTYLVFALGVFTIFYSMLEKTLLESAQITGLLSLLHLCGLFGSIFAYRLFFHPLRAFPGPSGARISKLWLLFQDIKSQYRTFLSFDELHRKYGKFVRIGAVH